MGYVKDRCPTFQNNLFKRNTSRWLKYFTGWDVYNTWDSNQYGQNNSEQGKWLNHIFAIFFLNPEEIGDCFFEEFIGTMPSGEKYQQFADFWRKSTPTLMHCFHPSFGRLAADNKCLRVFSLTLIISKYDLRNIMKCKFSCYSDKQKQWRS
jgi:hypothetical protein